MIVRALQFAKTFGETHLCETGIVIRNDINEITHKALTIKILIRSETLLNGIIMKASIT